MFKTKFHRLDSAKQAAILKGMRVAGTQDADRQTNHDFAEKNSKFRAACEAAGVKPTSRQAAKFRNHRGSAYGVA